MSIDDTYIVKQLKADTVNGFALLVKRYTEPIYWHIRRMVKCDDRENTARHTGHRCLPIGLYLYTCVSTEIVPNLRAVSVSLFIFLAVMAFRTVPTTFGGSYRMLRGHVS